MFWRTIVLCLVAVAASPVAGAETKAIRIMPLGDSLTMSAPGYRQALYKRLTQAGYKVAFVGSMKDDAKIVESPRHEGHGGFTIGPGKSKADAWASGKGNLFDNVDAWLKEKPDYVLLLIGTNDYFNIGDLQPEYNPNKTGAERLGGLLDKIHAASPDSKILVSSIMPVEWDANFAKPFNEAIPKLLEKRSFAVFVDLNKKTGFEKGDWSPDKLHPSERGYEKIAKGWFDALQTELGKP